MKRSVPRTSSAWLAAARPLAIAALASVLALTVLSSPAGAESTSQATRTQTASDTAKSTNCPKGSVAGATSNQVTVGATILTLNEGSLTNSSFGLPSIQGQENDWNLVAKSINKSGGAGCRKIVMKYYQVNPADSAGAQQVCLNIVADHPYILLDTGALTEVGTGNCIPTHQIPLVSNYLTKDELTKYHPYYLQVGDLPEDTVHNGTLGLKQLGYFGPSKGFKKVGLLYHNCSPDLIDAQQAALAAARVPKSKIVDYNLGCPTSGVDTPASFEQAVLSFKKAGVSAVIPVEIVDLGPFTQIAQQQNFKPQYLFAENDVPTSVATGANAPNPSNFDGAVDVVGAGYGEQTTPGFQPSGGTKKCNAIFSAVGEPNVYKQSDGYGGLVCDYLWYVQVLLNHATQLKSNTLANTMNSMGTVNFSYPLAPIDFSAAPHGSGYGVSYWRAVDYHASCKCWQVPNPTFNKPFP
jgi:hypothetical protein